MIPANKEYCSVILRIIKKIGKERKESILHTFCMLEKSGCQKHRIIFCGVFSSYLSHNEVCS